MKTLEDLTPEIKAKIPEYLARARNYYDGSLPFNKEATTEYLEYIYELGGEEKPMVLFADTPKDYVKKHSLLCVTRVEDEILKAYEDGESYEAVLDKYVAKANEDEAFKEEAKKASKGISKTNYFFLANSYSRCYLTWYRFIAKEFNLGSPELVEKVEKLYNLVIQSSIQQCFFQPKYILVLKNPDKVSFEDGKPHCEDGPAIKYSDWEGYYWKGGKVPKELIMSPDKVDRAMIEEWCDNAETRRAFIEVLGVSSYFNKIGDTDLKIVDEDYDDQKNIMKLYEFEFEGDTVQVLEVVCPSTDRVYNLYPPSQKCTNVYEAKADTFNQEKLVYRHGDVGLTVKGYEGKVITES